jgi:Ca2+-binding EF-hand superfamily protein
MSSKTKRYDTNPEKELILEGLEFFESSENPDIINPEEIKNLMDKLELKDKMPFIYDLISELCINKYNVPITKTDFITSIENKLNDTETKEGIHTIYNVFTDSNGDTLPMTNFCRTAREIGDMEKDEELKNLLKEAEMTGKELNFDEFHEIMTKEQSNSNKPKIDDRKYPKQKINTFARKKIWKKEENEQSEPSEGKNSQRNTYNNIQRYENINYANNTNEEYEPKNVYSYKRVKVEQTKKTSSPKNDEQKEEPITEKMVTVEEIITEKKVEAPNNNVRYKYKFRNRFRKEPREEQIKEKEKNEEKNEENNNNFNDNGEIKRYHRRYRGNYNNNNNNNEGQNDNNGNNNITFNRYRRNADN